MPTFGRSKANRRQTSKQEEIRLVIQEEREDAEEEMLFWDYEYGGDLDDHWSESGSLDSPFAVRANPSYEDLQWFSGS